MGAQSHEIFATKDYVAAALAQQAAIKTFRSARLAIVGGAGNYVAHGLGATPCIYAAALVCEVAELGYTVGDEVEFAGAYVDAGYNGYTLTADAAQIGLLIGGSTWIRVQRKDNVALTAPITPASWKILYKAIVW